MKKLLVALALIPTLAHAEALFETSNQGGGRIVLTDEKCNNGTNLLAYSMLPGYNTILGCWSSDSSFVHIRWYDGSLRSYDYSGWRDVRKTKPNT